MAEAQRLWIRSQVIAAMLINGIANALFAWLMNRGKPVVPSTREAFLLGLAIDVLITCLIVGILNAWSANYNLTKKGWKKKLIPPDSSTAFWARMWKWTTIPVLVLILLYAALVSGLTVAAFAIFDLANFTLLQYVVYKTVYTAILGGIATFFPAWAGGYRPDAKPEEYACNATPIS